MSRLLTTQRIRLSHSQPLSLFSPLRTIIPHYVTPQSPTLCASTYATSSSDAPIAPEKAHLIPKDGTYPLGFKATGLHCGVKKNGHRDLAVIVSDRPCAAAAVFTVNKFKAAPVLVSRDVLAKGAGEGVRALVANSGCANAVTGEKGLENAQTMAGAVDALVGVPSSSLVMSTGVIGQHLPIERVVAGVKDAYASLETGHQGWMKAANAFRTTDTFPKLCSGEFQLPGSKLTYRMAGITKGSGMIHPNMATLLSTIFTDAPVSAHVLREALKYTSDRSFNSITVDGDMSTNDTFAVLANGAAAADNPQAVIRDVNGEDFLQFREDLTTFAVKLAQLVVRDGEGATKFVTIKVKGAQTFEDAKRVALTIATSALVKTALFGQDANWGRILCAVGYSDVAIEPGKVSVSFVPTDGSKPLLLLARGEPENVDEDRASEILKMEDVEIQVELGIGNAEAQVWTCDFSYGYVKINAEYRT